MYKMKFSGIGLIAFGVGALLASSCFQLPEYSPIPTIDFTSIIFRDNPDPSAFDSLIVTVHFKDGDGDMGLDSKGDINAPYNDKNYVYYNGSIINYKIKRLAAKGDPKLDTLPAFVNPYNCTNWQILTVNGKTDTLYYHANPNTYNIFVQYFIKNTDGSFKEFNWVTEFPYPNCGIPFNGRFPVLSKDLTHKAPMEGTIRYGMVSTGFLILFSIKTLKLKVTIQDRALNKSNVLETPEFTLQQIKK
jgi:hypothetical protein